MLSLSFMTYPRQTIARLILTRKFDVVIIPEVSASIALRLLFERSLEYQQF